MIRLSAVADKLLKELKAKGIHLSLSGKRLRVKGNCSDELKEQVRRNKEGLIQLVELGEHKWRPVEEWNYWRDGNWIEGCRLDKPAWTRWKRNGQ